MIEYNIKNIIGKTGIEVVAVEKIKYTDKSIVVARHYYDKKEITDEIKEELKKIINKAK